MDEKRGENESALQKALRNSQEFLRIFAGRSSFDAAAYTPKMDASLEAYTAMYGHLHTSERDIAYQRDRQLAERGELSTPVGQRTSYVPQSQQPSLF